MKFLLRQGIALRGYSENKGNLPRLLSAWTVNSAILKHWVKEGKYMSHDTVNELLTLMGHNALRKYLCRMKNQSSEWYSLIGDEATDINYSEQLNVSIRYVDNDYNVHEDPIGLFALPSTGAETITSVVKDILLRCTLPIDLCTGQAYDGAAARIRQNVPQALPVHCLAHSLNLCLQDSGRKITLLRDALDIVREIVQLINKSPKRTLPIDLCTGQAYDGAAARIRQNVPQALPVHCLAHSLNLCLQDSGRKITLLRDALDIVREIVQLINKSPKRKHFFSEKLTNHESVHKGLKPLCPTSWTVRTEALDAVLKQYKVIIETMEEVHSTTHDEYGLKAGGIVTALEKFDTLFGLQLGHLLFGCAENTSKVLQAKDLLIQEAMSAVNVTRAFYQRQRQDDAFNVFYDSVVKGAKELEIGEPVLPRYRKAPQRYDDGAPHVQFSDPCSFYRQKYFEACHLLIQEMHDRFGKREVMKPIVTLESLLLKSANGEECIQELSDFNDSVYRQEFTIETLEQQLGILVDVIHVELPEVKKVTSVKVNL